MLVTQGRNITIIGALSNYGEVFTKLVDTINKEVVEQFIIEFDCKVDLRQSVIVLDNHKAHWGHNVREEAGRRECELLFLPFASSMFNPIETFWSLVKKKWR